MQGESTPFVIQLVFYKKKPMWFIGVEVKHGAPLPKVLDPSLSGWEGC